jgi:hypothetical protein
MICVINTVLYEWMRRGESLDKVRDYLKNRYQITIDKKCLKRRMKNLKLEFPE